MVEVLEHEGAEGSEAGLAAAQVPHGGNQQVGLLLGRGQQLQQLQELLVAGHAQGEPLVQQRPAASLPLGEASIALGDRHLDQFYGLLVRSGLSSTTVLQLHRILHHALRDAMRWNLVARNVAELVTPPRRAHHNFVTFSPEQARASWRRSGATGWERCTSSPSPPGCAKASCSAPMGRRQPSSPARCTSSGG
jgi:hypothetical protein